MSKKAPTLTQMAVIVIFTLSCFGLLLYLWLAFGGPTPLLAKSYEVKIPFPEATQLANQSDVRISGVSVGKVTGLELTEDGERTLATIQLQSRYGPIPADSRAMIRSKTLLSEAYVELTPGDPEGAELPDGGELSPARVARSIQLDEIMRAFDPKTRHAFGVWMQNSAVGAAGRGLSFSNAIGELQPTFAEFDSLLRVLDSQGAAVKHLFRDGATSFRALSRQKGQLSGMIRNFNTVFKTTAERNRELEEAFVAFPTFLDESRLTADRFAEFAVKTDPLMRQLKPVGTELSGALVQFGRFAPEFKGFVEGAAPVIQRADKAFPAAQRLFAEDFPPVLKAVQPFLYGINPLIEVVDSQRRELAAFVGNIAATLQGSQPGDDVSRPHYLRVMSMLGAQGFATFDKRLTVNRNNAYVKSGAYSDIGTGGLKSFHSQQCTSGVQGILDPTTPTNPNFLQRVGGDADAAEDFFERIKRFAFAGTDSTNALQAPGCVKQGKFNPIGNSGPATDYPQVLSGKP